MHAIFIYCRTVSDPQCDDDISVHAPQKAERVGPQPAEPPLVAAQGLPPHVPPPPPPPPMAPEPAPSADALCASAELVQLQVCAVSFQLLASLWVSAVG